MSLALISPTTFTDTSLPLFPLEAVPGTLLLIEPARSPSVVGVPASGAILPDRSGWLVGAGAELRYANMTAGIGLMERTSKGGIHSIKTPASQFAHAGIIPSAAVVQYMLDNIGHEFYIGIQGRITRPGLSGNDAHFAMSFSATAGTSQLLVASMADANTYPSTSVLKGAKKYPLTSMVSPAAPSAVFAAAGMKGYTGSITRTAADIIANRMASLFNVGSSGPFNSGNAGAASKVFYRAIIEDVTVSGRNFAALSAMDYSFFEAEVLTPGGRYYGDTFTAPSTIP